MDESAARQWLIDQLGVSRETLERLQDFVNLLREENERQNLVSRASLDQVWSRHIVDSAQLLRFAPAAAETWLDLGTGAGFPGLIVGLLRPGSVVLVEERARRADFLERAAEVSGIGDRVRIVASRVERFEAEPFDVISARAFAPLEKLLALGERFALQWLDLERLAIRPQNAHRTRRRRRVDPQQAQAARPAASPRRSCRWTICWR